MATLEPIVVNPPREKRTYTFNDEDIKQIVQQGINDGKIAIPQGTKLYNHHYFTENNSLDFISTKKEPFKIEDGLVLENDNYYCINLIYYDDNEGTFICNLVYFEKEDDDLLLRYEYPIGGDTGSYDWNEYEQRVTEL